jgi:hypothetical protein
MTRSASTVSVSCRRGPRSSSTIERWDAAEAALARSKSGFDVTMLPGEGAFTARRSASTSATCSSGLDARDGADRLRDARRFGLTYVTPGTEATRT